MLAHNRSKPGHVTQFTAQRFLASEVNTAARPSPYCQRTSSGSVRSASRIVSAVGRASKPHVAAQRRRVLHAHALQDLRLLHHLRLDLLLHRRDAGVLLHVAQQNLLQPRRIVQEIRFALRHRRHLLQERAIHVLPQPDRRNRDVVGQRLARQRHAVAFFGNAVGQQHDVLVDRGLRQNLLVRLGERRRDLRAAVGRDAGDQPLDRPRGPRPCGWAPPTETSCRRSARPPYRWAADSPPRRSPPAAPVRSCVLPWKTTCR